jgi:hypothetical protein
MPVLIRAKTDAQLLTENRLPIVTYYHSVNCSAIGDWRA